MNGRMIVRILAHILLIEAALMLFPLILAWAGGDGAALRGFRFVSRFLLFPLSPLLPLFPLPPTNRRRRRRPPLNRSTRSVPAKFGSTNRALESTRTAPDS